MFKRKKATEAAANDSDETPGDPAALEEAVLGRPEPAVTSGPWDPADLDPDDGVRRLDLGALRVPIPDALELRLEVDDAGNVGAAIIGDSRNSLQLNAFAAPRRGGLWDEVRSEIAQALTDQGVAAEEADGELGPELRARIPTGDAKGATTPARFVGYDGPRWFLRGLLTGPAATDPAQAAPFHAVFRDVVVVRGGDAMAPRDPLPLRLPTDARPQESAEADAASYDGLDPFERGPEITEIR